MTAITSLLGGLGLFLLGMWLMTEGLKVAAGDALRSILQTWTNSRQRGLLAGMLVTAVVQSSAAVTVATIGFVNAGMLSLGQAVWVIFGANVGTTMTAWLVALVGVKLNVAALALPMLGVGMLVRLFAFGHVRRAGLGQAIAGFGAFFLGVSFMQGAFVDLAPRFGELRLDDTGWLAVPLFVLVGAALTVAMQSSSAAIALSLTAVAGGAAPMDLAAAAIIGTNIGTTSAAMIASVGSTPPAKRVAMAHVIFNLSTGAAALILLPGLLWTARTIAGAVGGAADTVEALAVFHTLFNLLGILLIWPFAARLVAFLSRRFVTPDEEIGRPQHLDANLLAVPDVALRGLLLEAARMGDIAFALAREQASGRPVAPGGGARRAGVLRLGQAMRDFIAGLGAAPLPRNVVEALPDLLRAVQHFEEVATLGAGPGPDGPRLSGHDAEELRRVALESLSLEGEGAPLPALRETLNGLARRREEAYEAVKRGLLRAAAEGALRMADMDAALGAAQRVRKCADSAVKARLRLASAAAHAAGEGLAPAPESPAEAALPNGG